MNISSISNAIWNAPAQAPVAASPGATDKTALSVKGDRSAIPSGIQALWAQANSEDDPASLAAKVRAEQAREELRARMFAIAGFKTVNGGHVDIDVADVAKREEALARGRKA